MTAEEPKSAAAKNEIYQPEDQRTEMRTDPQVMEALLDVFVRLREQLESPILPRIESGSDADTALTKYAEIKDHLRAPTQSRPIEDDSRWEIPPVIEANPSERII